MTTQRRLARVDDDDLYDDDGNGPYDKRYPGRRVIADKGRVTVPILLTDGMPDWMPPRPRAALYDASHHRPHFADLTDARLQDGLRKAAEARDAWVRGLQDAWKTPSGQMQQPPDNDDDDDDDDGDLSPRDRYIQNLQTAYWMPIGQASPSGADGVEAQRRRVTREGGGGGLAPRGVTFGQGPTKDAAAGRALADQAYGEMCNRLEKAWRR